MTIPEAAHLVIQAGAMGKNTIRAYRSDYNDYAKLCLKYDCEPLNEDPEQMHL